MSSATATADEERYCSCGSKAVNLERLVQYGFQVPAALTVPAGEYRKFLQVNGLDKALAGLCANGSTDVHVLAANSILIRRWFEAAELPASCTACVAGWVRSSPGLFAVRSSAVEEDLPTASFAGLYDSYLNVAAGAVNDHIKRCFASLFNPRALLYRKRLGMSCAGAMAVLVQHMAAGRFAGAIFTEAPQSRDCLLIECVRGLGDGVVSGTARPNRYLVKRDSLVIEEAREIAEFDSQTVRELARLALRVEACFGNPQEVEFSVTPNGIYLLQARPMVRP